MNIIKQFERIDKLHRNDYRIIQNSKTFCFGIDSVLLSHFANAKKNEVVLDVGTGNAVIPILMSAKTNAKKFFAIDVQDESISMAKRSVYINNLQNKINVLKCNVNELGDYFENQYFDVVTTNPPYMKKGSFIINNINAKAIARHEILCTLEQIIENVSKVLKVKGRFYMVHRPNRLTDILENLRKYNLEPKKLRFVQPYQNKKPNLLLIEAIKFGGVELNIEPNLIIYKEDNNYTQEVFDIYYN